MNNFVLLNSTIFTDQGDTKKVHIIIKNGRIRDTVDSRYRITSLNYRYINLEGLHVIPGLIDSHTHFKLKLSANNYNSDDFISGSKACIAGGITTFIDFTNGDKNSFKEDIKERISEAEGKSHADYSFHHVIKKIERFKNLESEIKEALKLGIKSFKIFTAYKSRGLMMDNYNLIKLLELVKKYNLLLCIHSESEDIINYNINKFKKHLNKIHYLPIIRDHFSENYSVYNILKLNEYIKSNIYFVHISSYKSLAEIKKHRELNPKIYAETCPQYFVFNKDIYTKKNSRLYTFTPPVRDRENQKEMIKNLSDFDVIATDSCAFKSSDKKAKNILDIKMGIATSQLLLPLVYTYGVKKGKIKMNQLIKLLSTNPAEIFGLKWKGKIKKGYYADLCVFDPKESFTVKNAFLYHNSDYTPYEGMELWGKVKKTFLRGYLVFDNSKISEKPLGKFIKR